MSFSILPRLCEGFHLSCLCNIYVSSLGRPIKLTPRISSRSHGIGALEEAETKSKNYSFAYYYTYTGTRQIGTKEEKESEWPQDVDLIHLKVYRRQPSYCDKKESGEAGIAVSSVSCVHPRTGLLHRWLVTISLGWHRRCHAGGCRRGQGMRGQGRSCNWNFVSTSPLKLRCHVIKLNSQHGN